MTEWNGLGRRRQHWPGAGVQIEGWEWNRVPIKLPPGALSPNKAAGILAAHRDDHLSALDF